jgi:hypothetical protein
MSVSLRVQYSIDGGTRWLDCTPAPSSPLSSPDSGVPLGLSTFTWDTIADGVGTAAPAASVLVRTLVDDLVSPRKGECASAGFTVDNNGTCDSLCGDCDLDGAGPDVLDALAAAQIAVTILLPEPDQRSCCDVDTSGDVSILDALAIAQDAVGTPVMLSCP